MHPAAAMTCAASAGSIAGSTATIRPSRTATSARTTGPPVPSTTSPPWMSRSYMPVSVLPCGPGLLRPAENLDRPQEPQMAGGVHEQGRVAGCRQQGAEISPAGLVENPVERLEHAAHLGVCVRRRVGAVAR